MDDPTDFYLGVAGGGLLLACALCACARFIYVMCIHTPPEDYENELFEV
jgi:hypothetical protein